MGDKISLALAMTELREMASEAGRRGDIDASVGTLATVDEHGQPSARAVYVLLVDDQGPIFFVNKSSGKGRQLSSNPKACVSFFWPHFEQQAVIEGEAGLLDSGEADRLWQKRTRESQLAAWASDQSTTAVDAKSHRELLAQIKKRFDSGPIPRPDTWVAYRVAPSAITYWPSGWHRMYPRTRYERQASGEWTRWRVQP